MGRRKGRASSDRVKSEPKTGTAPWNVGQSWGTNEKVSSALPVSARRSARVPSGFHICIPWNTASTRCPLSGVQGRSFIRACRWG
jgi:hypothetical protein